MVQVKVSWVILLDLQRHGQRLMTDTGYVGGQGKIFAIKNVYGDGRRMFGNTGMKRIFKTWSYYLLRKCISDNTH